METRHVRLNYEEALSAKKQILSAELNLLRVMKHIRAYRHLRKKELINKNKIKSKLASLRAKIKTLKETFPKQELEKIKKPKTQKKKTKKDQNLEQELSDIKQKLEKLSK